MKLGSIVVVPLTLSAALLIGCAGGEQRSDTGGYTDADALADLLAGAEPVERLGKADGWNGPSDWEREYTHIGDNGNSCEMMSCTHGCEMVTHCSHSMAICFDHPVCDEPPPAQTVLVLGSCADLKCDFGYVCAENTNCSGDDCWVQPWCERDMGLCEQAAAEGITCPAGETCDVIIEYGWTPEDNRMIATCSEDDGDVVGWGGGGGGSASEAGTGWGTDAPQPCNGLCWHGARCTDYCPPAGSCSKVVSESPAFWQVHSCDYDGTY